MGILATFKNVPVIKNILFHFIPLFYMHQPTNLIIKSDRKKSCNSFAGINKTQYFLLKTPENLFT